jgi:hypothetical protein
MIRMNMSIKNITKRKSKFMNDSQVSISQITHRIYNERLGCFWISYNVGICRSFFIKKLSKNEWLHVNEIIKDTLAEISL